MTQQRLRIVLVHGQDLVRGGLKFILENDPGLEVVAEAGTCAEAELAIKSATPQVVVIGGQLRDGSSGSICRFVQEFDDAIGRLVLASADDDDALLGGLAGGAAVCLPERMSGGDLTDAVRRVADGQIFLDPKVTRRVLDLLVQGPDRVSRRLIDSMSPREREVLDCLGEGLTNRQIGEQLGLAEKTVKNYVSAIFAKLGLQRRSQAAAIAIGLANPR